MDTTLPVMVSALGSDWAFTSIVHAIVLDFTVPFAVIFSVPCFRSGLRAMRVKP